MLFPHYTYEAGEQLLSDKLFLLEYSKEIKSRSYITLDIILLFDTQII